MDVLGDFRTWLLNETSFGSLVEQVFINIVPDITALPAMYCKMTVANTVPITKPVTQWWAPIVILDISALDMNDALAAAEYLKVPGLLPQFVGVRETCVIVDCQIESVRPVVDDGWKPIRFRQVVTVDLTAREPREGEEP